MGAIVYAGQHRIKPKSSARVTQPDKRARPDDGGTPTDAPRHLQSHNYHSNADGAGKFGQIAGTDRTNEVGGNTLAAAPPGRDTQVAITGEPALKLCDKSSRPSLSR
uniref:Uncharacterized protein MLCB164.02c n=1 Tax=Mycobacterium leprae TaxID=1769 RepID=Q9X7C9_MYCLR|nr:hypothetical protein MLCB164.02c [Mycobacterium leprae]